ncbi:hypothetical protein D3C76_1444430 [compost metagenome]
MTRITHTVESVTIVRTGRTENYVSAFRFGHPYNFREFNIVTGQHGNAAFIGVEHLKSISGSHIPFLNFGWRNVNLVLAHDATIRVEHVGCIIQLPFTANDVGSPDDVHAVLGSK